MDEYLFIYYLDIRVHGKLRIINSMCCPTDETDSDIHLGDLF